MHHRDVDAAAQLAAGRQCEAPSYFAHVEAQEARRGAIRRWLADRRRLGCNPYSSAAGAPAGAPRRARQREEA